jgi:hypothetical protein
MGAIKTALDGSPLLDPKVKEAEFGRTFMSRMFAGTLYIPL